MSALGTSSVAGRGGIVTGCVIDGNVWDGVAIGNTPGPYTVGGNRISRNGRYGYWRAQPRPVGPADRADASGTRRPAERHPAADMAVTATTSGSNALDGDPHRLARARRVVAGNRLRSNGRPAAPGDRRAGATASYTRLPCTTPRRTGRRTGTPARWSPRARSRPSSWPTPPPSSSLAPVRPGAATAWPEGTPPQGPGTSCRTAPPPGPASPSRPPPTPPPSATTGPGTSARTPTQTHGLRITGDRQLRVGPGPRQRPGGQRRRRGRVSTPRRSAVAGTATTTRWTDAGGSSARRRGAVRLGVPLAQPVPGSPPGCTRAAAVRPARSPPRWPRRRRARPARVPSTTASLPHRPRLDPHEHQPRRGRGPDPDRRPVGVPGPQRADRAIQMTTNSPVNHVGMAVVLDDMPPLMWHAELGRSLPDMWTGGHQRGVQLHDLRDAVLRLGRPVRPAGLAAPARPAGRRRRWRTRCCAPSPGWTARRSRPRPGSPGAGCSGRVPQLRRGARRAPPWRPPTARRWSPSPTRRWACCPPGGRPNWYDPGRFWSGDDLDLAGGARLGGEIAVRIPPR